MLGIQFQIHFVNQVNSTNNYLKSLPAQNGLVVYSAYQTAGRGQANSVWESEVNKNLLCSILFEFNKVPVEQQAYINMAVSIALQQVVFKLAQTKCYIKWPNDIYINNRKIAGILIENSIQGENIKQTVVGIGLNVKQTHFFNKNAISLNNIINTPFEIEEVLNVLLEELSMAYESIKAGKWDEIIETYNAHLFRRHETSYFTINNQMVLGQIDSVNKQGLLEVLIGQTVQLFAHKEIGMII
ncbi:MAG: biotin--[acetyl-CoA-carboxylase] ligase [Bacteroidota bacterium]